MIIAGHEIPDGPLILVYDLPSDGWLICTADRSETIAWTALGPGQIVSEFEGAKITDRIHALLASPNGVKWMAG